MRSFRDWTPAFAGVTPPRLERVTRACQFRESGNPGPSRARAFLLPIVALTISTAALAQTPDYRNVGKTPTQDEIHAWDIAVGPDGKGLPPGSGIATEGAKIFANKCAACHGQNLEGSPLGPRLVGGEGTLKTLSPVRTIGSYWPFATSLWDYINRAMPRNAEGSLSADEVYSLTAFLLYRNKIIPEGDVIDAKSLPQVKMPNRDGFIPARLDDIHDLKKRGCHDGYCP